MKTRYTPSTRPKFKHDCEECRFLGHFEDRDCYVCMEGKPLSETFIVREGDEKPEYASMDTDGLREICARPEGPKSRLSRAFAHFYLDRDALPDEDEDKCACGMYKVHGYGKGHPGHSGYCPWRKR
jgi:hypothetical protein